MIVHQSKSRADGKRAAGKGCECLPDAKRRLYNIIPRAEQKHIIAAGIDDRHGKRRLAFKASGKDIVDVALKEQGHLPGKRRCARDGNEMLPFLRSCFFRALEACNKRLSQIVYVHPAHADAFDAVSFLRKRFYAVAEGIVSNVDARTVLKPGIGFVFGINSRNSFAAV